MPAPEQRYRITGKIYSTTICFRHLQPHPSLHPRDADADAAAFVAVALVAVSVLSRSSATVSCAPAPSSCDLQVCRDPQVCRDSRLEKSFAESSEVFRCFRLLLAGDLARPHVLCRGRTCVGDGTPSAHPQRNVSIELLIRTLHTLTRTPARVAHTQNAMLVTRTLYMRVYAIRALKKNGIT